jgi:hypothetical protein
MYFPVFRSSCFNALSIRARMYTKEEASRQRQAFWTTLGQYMRPVLSADGERVNWVNYKTGVPSVYFRMEAGTSGANMAIEITHSDRSNRNECFEKFVALRAVLHDTLGEEWDWAVSRTDEHGREISSISKVLQGVNIMRQEDWPDLISFFKQRMIALDEFWSMAKYGFV